MEKTFTYLDDFFSVNYVWIYSIEKEKTCERITVLSRRYYVDFRDRHDPFYIRNPSFDSFYQKKRAK